MKYINVDEWKRKTLFRFFHQSDIPQINICANIDVTNFVNFVRKENISFYYAMIHAAMHIANEIENFRYRVRDNQVVLHDKIHPAFTALTDDEEELFSLVTVGMGSDILQFVAACKEKIEKQTPFDLQEVAGRDDLIYITCIPWISFTQLTHTTSLNKNDSVPRIGWGKYFVDHEKVLLPFSVQVNHALADGVHIGRYFNKLQNHIDSL
jgi:Chloramphenicol O-acetyltransferase